MKWGDTQGHQGPPEFFLSAYGLPLKKPCVTELKHCFVSSKLKDKLGALCRVTFEAGQRAKTKFSMLPPRRKNEIGALLLQTEVQAGSKSGIGDKKRSAGRCRVQKMFSGTLWLII